MPKAHSSQNAAEFGPLPSSQTVLAAPIRPEFQMLTF